MAEIKGQGGEEGHRRSACTAVDGGRQEGEVVAGGRYRAGHESRSGIGFGGEERE